MAVVVRYFDHDNQDVFDALLDTVVVENGKGIGLYNSVKKLLEEKNIPLKNIVGFASDNCSSMMGSNNGFQKFLKDDLTSVFIIGCVCHSIALCASNAVKFLPANFETFLKNITSYFSRSSKRQRDFCVVQEAAHLPCYKIPKLSQTRWLSRENVISTVLDQYSALLLYFQREEKTDKIDGATMIYRTLIDGQTKPMLMFLQYVLTKINRINREFQSEEFRLHILFMMVTSEYKDLLSLFIKESLIISMKLSEIDPRNTNNHKPIGEIYLGGKTMAHIIKNPLHVDIDTRFRILCLRFLVELCDQIRKRLVMDENSQLAKFNVLDPRISSNIKMSPLSIIPLAAQFPQLIPEEELNELDDQWRSYRLIAEQIPIPHKNIPQYWFKLRKIKDGFQHPKFATLSEFMTNLTIMPHSSANVERIFSRMNAIKTKQTNSLKSETVKCKLLAKQLINRRNNTCVTWKPNLDLIKEVKDGVVRQRYQARITQNNSTVTINVVDDEHIVSDDEY